MLPEFGPLSAGAESKCKGRVLGKEEKIALLLCLAKEGHSRLMPESCAPPHLLDRIARSFRVKRRKKMFSDRITVGTNKDSSFLGGILVIKPGVKRLFTMLVFWVIA